MQVVFNFDIMLCQGFLLLLTILRYSFASGNIYHDSGGPRKWKEKYKQCGGKSQSPIPLPNACSAKERHDFPKFSKSNSYVTKPTNIKLSRDDHTVKIVYGNSRNFTVTGGPLRDTYSMAQIHFHWGDKDSHGSEHTIDEQAYSLEAHAVHFNQKYGSLEGAQNKSDGLMVMGYLFKTVGFTRNAAMNSLGQALNKLSKKDIKSVELAHDELFSISGLLPNFQNNYVTYNGSLTTPPCYETVTWIVNTSPINISKVCMVAFRRLYNVTPGLRDNFRPLQAVNGRRIVGMCKEKS